MRGVSYGFWATTHDDHVVARREHAIIKSPLFPAATITDFADMFEDGEAKSRKLAHHYRLVAQELQCEFLDTAEVVVSSKIDAIHFDLEEHRKLGQAVAARVRKIFGAA